MLPIYRLHYLLSYLMVKLGISGQHIRVHKPSWSSSLCPSFCGLCDSDSTVEIRGAKDFVQKLLPMASALTYISIFRQIWFLSFWFWIGSAFDVAWGVAETSGRRTLARVMLPRRELASRSSSQQEWPSSFPPQGLQSEIRMDLWTKRERDMLECEQNEKREQSTICTCRNHSNRFPRQEEAPTYCKTNAFHPEKSRNDCINKETTKPDSVSKRPCRHRQ